MAASIMASPAQAGGIYANEFGTPEMGTAGAGAEASALDASTAIPFYSPAGMTRLEGHQFIVAVGALDTSIQFQKDPATTFLGGDGGQAGNPIPLLTMAYVHSFTERFKFGVALFGAAGAALEYEPTWAGRKQAQESQILTMSLSPTLAYRIADWVSFGAGINVMATSLDLKVEGALPASQISIDGTDVGVSFNVSWMFEPGENTRIGLTYVSETDFDYAGDVSRTPGSLTAPVNTSLSLAQILRLGLYYDINRKLAIMGTLGWEDWSALENQFVSVGTAGTATIPRNWEDTYRFALGLHYRPADAWLLRFGVSYDTSPTEAADRTADLPVDTQLRFAFGFQQETSDLFSYGIELIYADLGDAEINSIGPVRDLVGSYSSNDYIGAAFNAQWRF